MKITFARTLIAAAALSLSAQAAAVNVFFFGDSLTDTGNTTQGIPFPFATNQVTDAFGNGVWANRFAATLGGSSLSSAFGGTNFAIAGAQTASVGTVGTAAYRPGVGAQVDLFQRSGWASRATSNDLFVIMIGGNDVQPGATSANPGQSIVNGLANIQNAVLDLYLNSGAKHFLIADMPAVQDTPKVRALDLVAPGTRGALRNYTDAWNVSVRFLHIAMPSDSCLGS